LKLNQSKFLEELRKIDKDIKSASLEVTRPTTLCLTNPTLNPNDEQEKYLVERQRRFYVSMNDASERLSYLLSLVEGNAFDVVMDDLYPILQEVWKKVLSTGAYRGTSVRDGFYEAINRPIGTPKEKVVKDLTLTCPICGDPVTALKDTFPMGPTHLCPRCGSVHARDYQGLRRS
jgi:ribosomal protein S27AE